MSLQLQLEEFQTDDASTFLREMGIKPAGGNSGKGAELGGVNYYEQGYKAGWDDAARMAEDDQSKFSAEFAHNLQDLGFTFHEARSHVIHSLEPLLIALVEKVIPELLAQTLVPRIVEEIIPFAEDMADTPILVVVSPSNLIALEPLLLAATTCPLELRQEASLGPGQVFLKSDKMEKQINLEGALTAITDAIAALGNENREAFAHG